MGAGVGDVGVSACEKGYMCEQRGLGAMLDISA